MVLNENEKKLICLALIQRQTERERIVEIYLDLEESKLTPSKEKEKYKTERENTEKEIKLLKNYFINFMKKNIATLNQWVPGSSP